MTFGNGNCISEDAFLDTILVYMFSIPELNEFCQYLLENTMNNRFDVRKKQKVKRTRPGTSNSMLPDRKQHLWRTTPSHATMRGAKEPEETRQDGIRHLLTFFWVVSNYQEKLTLCYLRPWICLFWHCPANVNLNRHAASRKHIIYRFRL